MDFFDNIAKELNLDPTIVVGVILGNRVAIHDVYSIHGTDTINYIITQFKAQIKTLNDIDLGIHAQEVADDYIATLPQALVNPHPLS